MSACVSASRVCAGCGAHFTPRRSDQRYCKDNRCRAERNRVWQERYRRTRGVEPRRLLQAPTPKYAAPRKFKPDRYEVDHLGIWRPLNGQRSEGSTVYVEVDIWGDES